MKKYLFTLLLIGTILDSFSQNLENGVYIYQNKTHDFVIDNSPEKIQIVVINKKLYLSQNGVAEQRVAPRYSDTPGKIWYEFQTDSCNYDFDITKTKLTLNSFDCKNGKKSTKMVFLKKSFSSRANIEAYRKKFLLEQLKKEGKIK
ncbi:hypothetical protein SKC37_02860 [Aquirufa sp. HETE-83D]|uniref:Uncharacterized protein n=1 Tax=Aquirufa esocilacus TaxID=3096513 RepID=A0ABW6DJU1_9BACT